MQSDYNELFKVVFELLSKEHARSVLEISGFETELGLLLSRNLKLRPDRVDISGNFLLSDGVSGNIYGNVYDSDVFQSLSELDTYDVIIVFHLFENIQPDEAAHILKALLEKARKQVILITPEYPYDLEHENKLSDVREYNPIFFLGFDFGYKMIRSASGNMQMYCFFPQPEYALLPCDEALLASEGDSGRDKKLDIAFILAHRSLTGAMKAFMQIMDVLASRGHRTTAYYRDNSAKTAIPEWWSHNSEKYSHEQIVIAEEEQYLDNIKTADVIFLSWLDQVAEFTKSQIPVVLWEQGSPAIYGEHPDLLLCKSDFRKYLHDTYRTEAFMLAVSDTVRVALKSKYNRESLYFPPGIDTKWYHPLPKKSNDVPNVLLIGPPSLKFKGFRHALMALELAWHSGLRFDVQWVSQHEFSLSSTSFNIELFISPPQDKLAELCRNADILLSASLYESFPLPPIEAMASGTSVIAMDCGGIMAYAEPESNMLLCRQGDVQAMSQSLMFLLENPDAREKLAARGRETAEKFSHDSLANQLETCLYRIVNAKGMIN
jgi:glycosyltransferase involved in cell wall biosynthesis